MKTNLTKAKKTTTFYALLEKYDGDIKKAKSSELARVKPNGLSELFKAWRAYDMFYPKQAKTHPTKGAFKRKPNLTS